MARPHGFPPPGSDAVNEIPADPFNERTGRLRRRWHTVLGIPVCFESDSAELLALADAAFAGGGRRGAPVARACRVRLRLAPTGRTNTTFGTAGRGRRPARPKLFSGGGVLGCAMDADNFATVVPALARACVSVSPPMLRFHYLVRYELLEFAVLTLLSRVHGLVPLHAGCFGAGRRAVLVIGGSGAGKSTLCLEALAQGLELVAEDSVFVRARSLGASGLNSYLYMRNSSLAFARGELAEGLRTAPRIRRRSGVRKAMLDLRGGEFRLAARPLRIAAVVSLVPRATGAAPLRRIGAARIGAVLDATQAYARRQPGWREFRARVARLPAFELSRVPPTDAVRMLHGLLSHKGRDP